jgi:hypothetical protein
MLTGIHRNRQITRRAMSKKIAQNSARLLSLNERPCSEQVDHGMVDLIIEQTVTLCPREVHGRLDKAVQLELPKRAPTPAASRVLLRSRWILRSSYTRPGDCMTPSFC